MYCETKGRGLDWQEPGISHRWLDGPRSVPIPRLWEKKACPGLNRPANVVRPFVLVGRGVEFSRDRAQYAQGVDGCEVLRIRRDPLDRESDQKYLKAG